MEGQFINTHVHISKILKINISYILIKPAYLKTQITIQALFGSPFIFAKWVADRGPTRPT